MTERLIHTHTHTIKCTIFKKRFFFFMWMIFKVFIEFVIVLPLLFMFWFLACRILVFPPLNPELEVKVLTTGLPGHP